MDRLLAAKGGNPSAAGSAQRDIRGKLMLARLPTMSPILVQLLDLCQRDDLNLSDLSALIGRDAGMVAQIFALSTSAAFQGRTRPATLDQCLSLLGMNTIKTLVINGSVMQVFNRLVDWQEVDLGEFWGHSLRTALIARELARRMHYPSLEEAYLGGLVHDIGRLALLATVPEDYQSIFRDYQDGESLCAAEHAAFGLTHVEVGAWMVEKWQLDSFLGDSVLYHHEPFERMVSAPPLVRIVLLADYLAASHTTEHPQPDASAVALCGAALDDLPALLAAVERDLLNIAEQLGIRLSGPKAGELAPQADALLAARLQDMLLVNQALGQSSGSASAMQIAVQALKILFDLDAALCFEAIEGESERFRAKPLAHHSAKLAQLEFVRGSSTSLLARALDGVPQLVMRQGQLPLLDDQVLRSLGGEGMLLLPLRTASARIGVLVAVIDSADRAAALAAKLPCLAVFGCLSADRIALQRRSGNAAALDGGEAGADSRLNRLVHELNNPLAIIRNYVSILEAASAGKGAPQPELAIVREEIDRVAHMLRAAREQQAEGAAARGPVKLNRIVEDLATLFRGSIPFAGLVDIRLDLAEALPDIVSDRDRLKQLLVNLIKNALEAMPQGGRVTLSTAAWGLGEAGASHVEIRVEDNGPGIPKEVLAQLYQPVASQKPGFHQGLGLAIVGQLVRDLNGLINCRSDQQGTRFQVLLPLDRQ
ncbi:HDOD domain-containing protein [Pseudogulbenkiania subflava]|uniref:histidine kinase n=1 Tax=Pseudogulbenkiania subflava DSM 22618 TaxID=1123014 RepID=A0A1Y6BRI6_9NEIS|nr:HDOD domain-containing protein [Pseudogulbenkiania subflava]SMF17298.1 HDIG domain-containing protein [Pseudogulbenkiania subflava DSM 22618]